MNYYPHHIGDFNSATRHLTRIERSIYRDLIELYYDTEAPLVAEFEKLCRLVIARSDEERTAVQQVLNEFFTETEQGWCHSRCDGEIAKYHGNKEAKSAAGKASAAKRAQKQQQPINTSSTPVQQPLSECATNQNQEPRTNNQGPEEIKEPPPVRVPSLSVANLVSRGVEKKTAEEFLVIRRKKRVPLTEIAMAGIVREAGIAGWSIDSALKKCIERGWQSFEASWITNRAASNVQPLNRQEAQEARNREVAERFSRGA
ncbi:YdaU family protein [Alcaligenaceae bacterium B3P038]|nr:YdaU family protein [Alcaligenaceae bacterium B3P038]